MTSITFESDGHFNSLLSQVRNNKLRTTVFTCTSYNLNRDALWYAFGPLIEQDCCSLPVNGITTEYASPM